MGPRVTGVTWWKGRSVPAYGYAEPGALEAALASGDHVLVFSSVVDQEVVDWEVDP